MTCPTITNLHAILAAHEAPQGPSKANTIKAIALLLSDWIDVKTRLPAHGQRVQFMSDSCVWVETRNSCEPIGRATHWRPVSADASDATECDPSCVTLNQQFVAEVATGLVYVGELRAMGQPQPVAAQGGITISATAMQEIRALIANLAAVVRVQNGNLHEDTNSLLTHADKAIAILAAKGGAQ